MKPHIRREFCELRHTFAILSHVRAPPLFLALSGLAFAAGAASLNVSVKDDKGNPVADAVVYAMPKAKPAPAPVKREAAVEQKDKTFIPLVTAIQVGTPVNFPNHDVVRHHVYSFSAPKPFEIKLYVGTPVAPIVFDKPGEVVLGCNIHDHMLAYIYVVDTPWFAKTGASGTASVDDVPAGDYDIEIWHYALAAPQPAQLLHVTADKATAAFTVPLRAASLRAAPAH
jgi:plastocyanin